jgi:hypothetical protein
MLVRFYKLDLNKKSVERGVIVYLWTIVAAKQTRAEIRVNSVTFFLASSSQYFHHNG